MREDTFRRKKASQLFKDIGGRGWLAGRMAGILFSGLKPILLRRPRLASVRRIWRCQFSVVQVLFRSWFLLAFKSP